MKGTELYFPVLLFIMLNKLIVTFELQTKSLSVTIQMKATEQYAVYYAVQGGSNVWVCG